MTSRIIDLRACVLLSTIRSRWSLVVVIAIPLAKTVSLIAESLESVSIILRFVGTRMFEFAVV